MVQAQGRESRHVFRTHVTTRGMIGIEGALHGADVPQDHDVEHKPEPPVGLRQDWVHAWHPGRARLDRFLSRFPLRSQQLTHQRLPPGTMLPSLLR